MGRSPRRAELRVNGQVAFRSLLVAESFVHRAKGLMFAPALPDWAGDGILFPNCRSLHTCFMRFELDMVFLDADRQPLEYQRRVSPWRCARGPSGTRHCLEVPAGRLPADTSGTWEWNISEHS